MSPLPERIGPYRIIRALAEGGSGQVFEGHHEHLERRVAIKVLSPDYAKNRETSARFIREAKVLAQFDKHPGIVQVIEFGETEHGVPYLVMELFDGKNLRSWLQEQARPLPQHIALTLGQSIASIMVDVHAKELVHRDLKPENIMLVPSADKPLGFQLKIVDFGIAKAPEPAATDGYAPTHLQTKGHDVFGTHAYMAPEQCRNADLVTSQVDVYALGILMHELLSGERPFQSDDDMELMYMHLQNRPPSLLDCVPSIPPDLATFVTSMLAKAPNDRPSMRDCRDMFARDWSHDTTDCPFPGLQPFNDAQAHLFFGRREETGVLLGKLDEIHDGHDRKWLQIQGPSGIGKSSLVRAGLLRDNVRSQHWYVVSMRPGQDPLHNLVAAFATTFQQDEQKLLAAFRKNPDALDGLLESSDRPILLVIDAFEEWFALGATHIPHFTKWLKKALARPNSPLRLLTTIRSDYLHRFDQTLELAQLLDRHAFRYDLRPMTEPALAEVVEGMAGRAGLRLSKGLPEKMVRDAAGTDCHLPLLGHTLRTLWSRRGSGEITHEHYGAMGGVGGALANRVKELLNGFSDTERERAKWLILDLVQIGQGGPDTRRPRIREDAIRAAGEDKLAEDVVASLSGMNLQADDEPFRLVIVSDTEDATKRQVIELVHDMVLHKVPVVVQWINEHRALLELLGALESLARAWVNAGKPKRELPAGTLLDHYRGGQDAARVQRMASANARAFLEEAIRQQKQQMWLKRGIGAMMALAVLAIVVNAVRAEREKERAEFARAEAEREKRRTEIEKTRAEREKERAEENLSAWLSTTDRVVDDLDWELSWRHGTFETRRDTLNFLDEKLTPFVANNVELARPALVRTRHRRSDLARTHGTLEEADDFLTQTQTLIAEGRKRGVPMDVVRVLEAMQLSKHGKVLAARNEWDKAIIEFGESTNLFDQLPKETLGRTSMLATSYLELADAELHERLPSATEHFNKTIELRESILPKDAYYSSLVVDALVHRARAACTLGQPQNALDDLNKALELQQSILAREPHNTFFQLIMARIHVALADTYVIDKNWLFARNEYKLARERAESLFHGDKQHKEYALVLGGALDGLIEVGAKIPDTTSIAELRDLRCSVLTSFASRDPADQRFNTQGCP